MNERDFLNCLLHDDFVTQADLEYYSEWELLCISRNLLRMNNYITNILCPEEP